MKSSIVTLSTLIVLVSLLFFKNSTSIIAADMVDLPVRINFRNEIIKPIYDSKILVHAIEQKLMH